jgi:hypothetical protein
VLGRHAHPVPVGARLGPRRHAGAGRALHPAGAQRLAEQLAELAVLVRAFGQLLRVEVEGAPSSEAARLNAALDRLQRSRTRWDEVLLADPREHLALWELNAAVVALVDRMLLAFDTAEHVRLWEDRRRQAALRRAAGVVAKVRPTRRHTARDRPRRTGRSRPTPRRGFSTSDGSHDRDH